MSALTRKEKEPEKRQILVNENASLWKVKEEARGKPEYIGDALKRLRLDAKLSQGPAPPTDIKREYLAREILAVLKDEHSLGYYRKVASEIPANEIFEALSTLRQMARERPIRNRGAYFTSLIATARSSGQYRPGAHIAGHGEAGE